jgi:hypothetical protein
MPSRSSAAVRTAVVVSLFALAYVVAPAGAQATRPAAPAPATQPSSRVERLLVELAHPEPAVREDAYTQLLMLDRDDLPALREAIAAARPLTPAQSAVLREVVTQAFLAGEPYAVDERLSGFLGLMQPTTESVVVFREGEAGEAGDAGRVVHADGTRFQIGVPVGERLPGFCAYRALRSGDVILGLLDRHRIALREWRELQNAVSQAGPGETVTFDVLRNGRKLQVRIRLDPRPRGAADIGLIEDLRRREERADQYWEANFAPLVGREVS